MPSDLSAPGALAFESIPAQGGEYAGPGAKRELARIFRRDGCHHCGEGAPPAAGSGGGCSCSSATTAGPRTRP